MYIHSLLSYKFFFFYKFKNIEKNKIFQSELNACKLKKKCYFEML